ncbi:MAG: hypothetical protein FJX35_27890 [Alphaproteobacteria bacterium]|nr:hypothetical protein [Alphaproteobacteria bacterium]
MAIKLYEPTVLMALIERVEAGSTMVEWRRGRIEYVIKREARLIIYPEQENWLNFWEDIQDIGFWEWGPDYDVLEGEGINWYVDVRFRGRRHRSRGSNAFPPRFGEFCVALTRLMNGADFS